MERLKDLREQKWAWAAVGLIVGLALGLLYAWVISPVEWKDASPSLLSEPYRQEWLRMAIDSYAANRDADLALTRYQALGELGEAGPEGLAVWRVAGGHRHLYCDRERDLYSHRDRDPDADRHADAHEHRDRD